MKTQKPLEPVKPEGMEIILYYPCPFCERRVPIIAPIEPIMVRCDACGRQFPVAPADDKSIRFIKVILDFGRAAISPDFI